MRSMNSTTLGKWDGSLGCIVDVCSPEWEGGEGRGRVLVQNHGPPLDD